MAKKVLIIDEDNSYTDAVKDSLSAGGYEAIVSNSIKDGLNRAKEGISIIVLEAVFDNKPAGIDLVKQLKTNKDTQSIPVLMHTDIRTRMNLPFMLELDNEHLPADSLF